MRRHRRSSGFTLFELLVVIALVSVLAFVAFDRLAYYQEAAEAAAAESNLSVLKSALSIRSAELITANRWDDLRRLPEKNPFDLMEEPPASYGGRFEPTAPGGKWYYDEAAHAVVYRVARAERFSADDGSHDMRFAVVGKNTAGQVVAGEGVAYASLRPVGRYRWLDRTFR